MSKPLTLLDLVTAVQDASDSDTEVIATLVDLLASNRVRVGGRRTGTRFPSPPMQVAV